MDKAEFLRAEAKACRERIEACPDARERNALTTLANHYEREARHAEREQQQRSGWQQADVHA